MSVDGPGNRPFNPTVALAHSSRLAPGSALPGKALDWPLPSMAASGENKGVVAELAVADATGQRPRIFRLTRAGPVYQEALSSGARTPLDRMRAIFELAYRLEAGVDPRPDPGNPTPWDAASWSDLWLARSDRFPEWLTRLPETGPGRHVPLQEVLGALAEIHRVFRTWPALRGWLRAKGSEASTAPGLNAASAPKGMRYFGARLAAFSLDVARVWTAPAEAGRESMGPFVGWLGSDNPVLFSGAPLVDRDLMRLWMTKVDAALNSRVERLAPLPGQGCVSAQFAPRAGIVEVREVESGIDAADGPLQGYFQARLGGGLAREFLANGELELRASASGKKILSATLLLDEYLARVVDRAGASANAEAAKALAVVARTEALSWPLDWRGCRFPATSAVDLSFSLSPASLAARRAVAWTREIAIAMPPVAQKQALRAGAASYGPGALKLADRGLFYDEILRAIGPGARLVLATTAAAPAPKKER